MSNRLYLLSVACPAGTLSSAPQSQRWDMEDAYLYRLTIVVPDGHAGLTGIRFRRSGAIVVPYTFDQFIVANDRVINFDYNGEIHSSGLVIETYNTDVFDHTFYLEATIGDTNPNPTQQVSATSAIPTAALSGTA